MVDGPFPDTVLEVLDVAEGKKANDGFAEST